MKLILFFFMLMPAAHAYTLNNNFGASFKSHNVKVTVDQLSNCGYSQVTIYELEELVKEANKFWNDIPTSQLNLKWGGFSGPYNNMTSGVLCAPTDDPCISGAGGNVIEPVKEIVISCNDNADNFESNDVIAVTIPNNFAGKSITGAVILINETLNNSPFVGLNRADRIGVIAHEIGHAIGLGHTDDKAALMYYRTVNLRTRLGEDDMRGVSYLYPMQVDGFGLLGGCGTIQNKDGTPPMNPPFWQMGAALGLVIMIVELLKLLKRSQTSSAA